jgi:hypothetical protein
MKLSTVRITNLKSLADTGDIALGQINVLLGRNNHGKSAFIRGVHLMQQPGPNISVSDVRLGEQQASAHFTLTGENPEDLQRYFGTEVAQSSLDFVVNLGRSGDPNQHNVSISISSSRPNRGPSLLSQQEPDNFIYTYLSKRKVAQFERTVNRASTLAVQPDLRYLVAKVARLSNPDYERADEYTRLCNAVLGFRITVHPANDGNGQQAGIPVGKYGYIAIESMGEGVSSQLGLIADLCMADGNLFLIEEPENDIHPDGLKTLLDVIVEKSRQNQFIVTTHSNIVTRYLGAAPGSKIFEFESEFKPNAIPTSTVHEVEQTATARIAVLRKLGYELSDFDLWEGWLILEESSAEIIIRNYLIPWFAPKLARIRTLSAGGTSKVTPTFEDFRRLFLFAHLEPQYKDRAWVVADGDDSGKRTVKQLHEKYKSWPADHFRTWSNSDFEFFYPPTFDQQVKEALGKSGDEKRQAKKLLLADVKTWCDTNPDEAKVAFEKSAPEVIALLREIETALFGGQVPTVT